MAYVPVPKDLTTVKTKVMFNLTKRQLICFGAGAAVALPLFFLCKKSMDTSVASIIMIVVLLPFMLLAMYEKHGQPLEKIVYNIVQVCFLRPKQRTYRTNNFWLCCLGFPVHLCISVCSYHHLFNCCNQYSKRY